MVDAFAEGSVALKMVQGLRLLHPYWTIHGGGALVYHLRHRAVKELDFFREEAFWDDATAEATVNLILTPDMPGYEAYREQALTRFRSDMGVFKVNYKQITLSFVSGPAVKGTHQRVGDESHLRFASLKDVVGAKMLALFGRKVATDYTDMAAVLDHGITPAQIIDAARQTEKLQSDLFIERFGHFSIEQALLNLTNPPDEADDLLTGRQFENLQNLSREGLKILAMRETG